jgi:hypothetical protein
MTTSTGCENWPPPVPFLPNGAVTHNRSQRSTSNIPATVNAVILAGRTRTKSDESPMNKDESDRIHELCSLIAVEQDRKTFLTLVEELNRILSSEDRRLQKTQNQDQEKD